jgi:CheY-like chemotaxis protein
MPGLDGLDATRQIRSSNDPRVRRVKCIALTANAIEGDRERCISAGMNGYLSKVSLHEVSSVVLC